MTVYVIRRKNDESGLVKIGVTKQPLNKRLSNMATSSPEGFDVLHELDGGADLELTLHTAFEAKREKREWFRLSEDDLAAIPLVQDRPQNLRQRHIPSPSDVDGDSIVFEARYYLNELVKREWRGIGDSVEDARDRVMTECGHLPSYGFRLWHKYTELSDVSGEVYRCLRLRFAMLLMSEGMLDEPQTRFLSGLVRTYRNIPSLQEQTGYGVGFIVDLIKMDWEPASAGMGMAAPVVGATNRKKA
jgi:hypothetical protein